MRVSFSKYCLPVALAGLVFAQGSLSYREVDNLEPSYEFAIVVDEPLADTVIHDIYGYRKGWTDEEVVEISSIADSLLQSGGFITDDSPVEYFRPAAMDSLVPPDSLLQIDTFFYKYYAAIKDSVCHKYVRDSLVAAGDSLDWPKVDSLYFADSLIVAKEKFMAWYNGLDPAARKNYDKEQLIIKKMARSDSIAAAKDSIKLHKDSVIQNTPRILETYILPDSLLYRRIISWTHDQEFHNITMRDMDEDVSLNYRFNDYPFLKKDVGASWLGVAGSPLQYYDFFNRKSEEGVFFYESQEAWTYNPHTLPMYNTKTPYTELAYWGTLLAAAKKESDNLHLMTTQNISPALNFTLGYDRFGGGGMLANETTKNKTTYMHVNYLGKKYLMHAGYIYNVVDRKENGGIEDNYFIRDTTVDAREIGTRLSAASSLIKKNTLFLDQQYRIPLDFLKRRPKADTTAVQSDSTVLIEAVPEEFASAEGEEDETNMDGGIVTAEEEVPTAFIGHSSEYTGIWRNYTDALSTASDKSFYQNAYYSPTSSFDSLSVRKLENKVFARLQPWTAESVVSNLDVGLGHKLLQYTETDTRYLYRPTRHNWSSTYMYAGAGGQFKSYVNWDALGHYVLLGDEFGDFDLEANAGIDVFPFRRAKTSPLRFKAHFETRLDEPEYYLQSLRTNHFKWNNDFSKISTTKVNGTIEIPRWNFKASAGYALLANNIYFDTNSLVCQNQTPMSIFSASLEENIRLGLLHLDNRALFQLSSNEEVLPLPLVALNSRLYLQLRLGVGEEKAMTMQIGANVLYNTAWYAPSWNPALGVFYNQTELKYGNAPYIDAFVNVQWKRACIFLKLENAGMGWPLEKADYFSANHYIRTQRAFKIGIFWPFFTQPAKLDKIPGPDDDPSDYY